MLLKQVCNDCIFLHNFCFEFRNFLVVLIFLPAFFAFVNAQGQLTIFKEFLLPVIILRWLNVVLITTLRNRHFLKQVLPNNRQFFRGLERASRAFGHVFVFPRL